MQTIDRNGILYLAEGQIVHVDIVENISTRYPRSEYSERPMRYMVLLDGETRPRRVYAKPIGNVLVIYIKSRGNYIFCESELFRAL